MAEHSTIPPDQFLSGVESKEENKSSSAKVWQLHILSKHFGFTDSLLICQDYRQELRLTYEDNLFPQSLMVATNISYQKVGTAKTS